MATEHLTAPTSLCDLFHEPELCQDEILTILQTLDDNNNNNIFNVAVSSSASATPCQPVLMGGKNSTTAHNNNQNNKRRRTKPVAKTASSSSPGFGSDEDFSDDDHAVLSSKRKSVKRLKDSRPATSMDDVSGEDNGAGNGKVVSHIAVERNRRKQMNEHLAVLRQLMPCFYVKKGDQASIIGGVIDYINELQQVLQSLEAKKQRKIYTSEVGMSPRVASSPRLLMPQQLSKPSPVSPRKPPLSPISLVTMPISPSTPQSTSPYKPLIRQHLIQPSSIITSPTSNSNSSACSSFADMIMMMNNSHSNNNYSGVINELVASSKSNVAEVEVKFCGPNLELKTLSSKTAGQTLKMVSAIEDLSLEILKVSINTFEQTMLNAFIIKIGIECQLSAEELAQQIQQTFC